MSASVNRREALKSMAAVTLVAGLPALPEEVAAAAGLPLADEETTPDLHSSYHLAWCRLTPGGFVVEEYIDPEEMDQIFEWFLRFNTGDRDLDVPSRLRDASGVLYLIATKRGLGEFVAH